MSIISKLLVLMEVFRDTALIQRDDYTNAGKVSSHIKAMLKDFGVANDVLRRIAIACYEAEINMIIHSYGGKIEWWLNEDGWLLLAFIDDGPGISDLDKALTPGFSTASLKAREFGFGAGMGLPNIKRVSDTFSITSSEKGTHLEIGFQIG